MFSFQGRLAICVATGLVLAGLLLATLATLDAQSQTIEARVSAQRLDDGRTEFAMQHRVNASASWSERLLPRARLLWADPPRDNHWYNSTPMFIGSQETGQLELRVSAKRLSDGRTAFALQQRRAGQWLDRVEPRVNLLWAHPPRLNHWYISSAVSFDLSARPGMMTSDGEDSAAPADTATSTTTTTTSTGGFQPIVAEKAETASGVVYEATKDPVSDVVTTKVQITAVSGSFLGIVGKLKVRMECVDGEFAVWTSGFPNDFDGNSQITYRIDDQQPVTDFWETQVVFLGVESSPSDDRAFAQMLSNSSTFALRFKILFIERTAKFKLRGFFTTPVQQNLDRCGES